jgi:hypothetical protein
MPFTSKVLFESKKYKSPSKERTIENEGLKNIHL